MHGNWTDDLLPSLPLPPLFSSPPLHYTPLPPLPSVPLHPPLPVWLNDPSTAPKLQLTTIKYKNDVSSRANQCSSAIKSVKNEVIRLLLNRKLFNYIIIVTKMIISVYHSLFTLLSFPFFPSSALLALLLLCSVLFCFVTMFF